MKRGGSSTHGGVNAQDWAAISLFLQYISYTDFDYIGLEQPNLKDFNLVFTSGKKIICESKKQTLTYADIKEILDGVDENDFNDRDEIIIVCEGVSKELKQDLEWYKYLEANKEKLVKKGYLEKHFKLLPKLSFYEVKKEENEKIAYGLFTKLFGMWIPESSLKEMVDSLVLQNIYYGSEEAKKYHKKDFFSEIERRKKEIAAESGYYNEEESKIKHIETVYSALKQPGHKKDWSISAIKSLTASPDLHYLTIKKLKDAKDLDLTIWNQFWKATLNGAFSLEVMDIFQNNSHIPENQQYLIDLFPTVIGTIVDSFRDRFYQVDIAKTCSKIFSTTDKYNLQIFEILKQLLGSDNDSYLYIKNRQDDSWEEEEICNILRDLFTKSNDPKLQQNIIEYLFQKFNLVDDSGEYWHHSPGSLFEILKIYAESNTEEKIEELKVLLVNQCDAAEKKRYGSKSNYNGSESWSFANDRHYVDQVLEPALCKYYDNQPEKAWSYVTKCVVRDQKKISKDTPDFMNRMALTMLLNEYKNGTHQDEALEILIDFINMTTIPSKVGLILVKANQIDLPADKKWKLIEAQLNYPPYKGYPIEETESCVNELAKKGYSTAVELLAKWAQDPKYNESKGIVGPSAIETVPQLINNPATKVRGLQMMKDYLNSDHFINNLGTFKVWDIAKAIVEILRSDYQEGKSLLEEIWSKQPLSKNQQAVISSVLNNITNEDGKLVTKLYTDLISKWFDDCKDSPEAFRNFFTLSDDRESFISFGDKLADLRNYDAVMRIVQLLINDPSPQIENEDGTDDDSNLHQKIIKGEYTSSLRGVRARICFLLQKVIILPGRDYIPRVIPLVASLSQDENYYVRSTACFPLELLMRQRNTYISEETHERFLTVKDAEAIEKIAWDMFNDEENHKLPQVLKDIVGVANKFRNLSEEEAINIFETLTSIGDKKAISDAVDMFLFYAEYRKECFKNEKLKVIYGEDKWKQLNKYDGSKFKKLFIEYLGNKDTLVDVKSHFAWLLRKMPEDSSGKGFKLALEYFPYLLNEYHQRTFVSLYSFIEKNLEDFYKECISLWKTAIEKEKDFISKELNDSNLHEMHWWPYHHNGMILKQIAENEGESEFLKWLNALLDYPDKILILNDTEEVSQKLISLPVNDETKKVFEKFVTRFPSFFEAMKQWLEK